MDTLISLLIERQKCDKEFLHIWNRDNKRIGHSYSEIFRESKRYAEFFKKLGLKPGERVVIALLTRIEFFYAFFGIILAGGIPVPVHPPIFILEWDEYKEKFLHIFTNSKPSFLLCYKEVYHSFSEKILKDVFEKENILVLEELTVPQNSDDFVVEMPQPDDCAFIQFTSGSTGLPKGAILTHGALINNIDSIIKRIKLGSEDVIASWLPLYHDMGLIGNFLSTLYCGCTICLVPTEFFVMQPTIFFKIITEYKATIINSPNFGYVICNKYVNFKKMEGVDLSSLKFSLIGADHIEFNDMQEFNEKFSSFNMNESAFLPVYGVAESCVAVTMSEPQSSVKIDYLDREILSSEGRVVTVNTQEIGFVKAVAVGKPIEGQQVIICDETGNVLQHEMLGEICIKSCMLMDGYVNMKEKTENSFRDGWLLSGDLGYMKDNELYYFERKADLIKKGGKLYSPKEFENYCWSISDIKRGRSAALAISKESAADENDIYLLIETATFYREKYIEIIEELNSMYLEGIGIVPDYVHVVTRGSIPQTSSGKLERYKCRKKVINETFDVNFIYDNIKKDVIFCK